MATNQGSFTLTNDEKRDIKRLARKAGLSFSNYVRRELKLKILQHGDWKRTRLKKAAEQPTEGRNDA